MYCSTLKIMRGDCRKTCTARIITISIMASLYPKNQKPTDTVVDLIRSTPPLPLTKLAVNLKWRKRVSDKLERHYPGVGR